MSQSEESRSSLEAAVLPQKARHQAWFEGWKILRSSLSNLGGSTDDQRLGAPKSGEGARASGLEHAAIGSTWSRWRLPSRAGLKAAVRASSLKSAIQVEGRRVRPVPDARPRHGASTLQHEPSVDAGRERITRDVPRSRRPEAGSPLETVDEPQGGGRSAWFQREQEGDTVASPLDGAVLVQGGPRSTEHARAAGKEGPRTLDAAGEPMAGSSPRNPGLAREIEVSALEALARLAQAGWPRDTAAMVDQPRSPLEALVRLLDEEGGAGGDRLVQLLEESNLEALGRPSADRSQRLTRRRPDMATPDPSTLERILVELLRTDSGTRARLMSGLEALLAGVEPGRGPAAAALVRRKSTLEALLAILATRMGETRGGAGGISSLESLLWSSIGAGLGSEPSDEVPTGSSLGRADHTLPDAAARLRRDGQTPPVAPPTSGMDAAMAVPVLPLSSRRTAQPQPEPEPEPPTDGRTVVDPVTFTVVGNLASGQVCPSCGGPLRQVLERRSEVLDVRYQRFERVEIFRGLHDCPRCALQDPVLAALPALLVPSSRLGNGAVAQVIASRYADHLSFQQQARLLGQLGRSFSHDALGAVAVAVDDAVRPVLQALLAELRAESSLAVSAVALETVTVGARRPETGTVRAISGAAGVLFSYAADDEESEGPLAGWGGRQREDLDTARRLYRSSRNMDRGGKWSLVRQRFGLALPTSPDAARFALSRLQGAYAGPPAQVTAELKRLQAWLAEQRGTFKRAATPLQHAVETALQMWDAIYPFEPDGKLRPDVVPPPTRAGGAAIWPFQTWEGGAATAMHWYSLVESCACQGIYPWEYLWAVFGAFAEEPDRDPAPWTPRAWAVRSGRSTRS